MEQPAQFEGWAIVELFGRNQEIGYVTTRYFGTACLFQVDAPMLPEREYVLEQPQYINGKWLEKGSKVRKKMAAARSRLLGPGAIYALNPCTEEAAMLAIERLAGREIVVLEVPKKEVLELPHATQEEVCEECGSSPEDGHEIGCSFDDELLDQQIEGAESAGG
jgi:hypothetical protein